MFSCKDSQSLDTGLTLMAASSLDYICKGLISKLGHKHWNRGLGFLQSPFIIYLCIYVFIEEGGIRIRKWVQKDGGGTSTVLLPDSKGVFMCTYVHVRTHEC